MGPKARVSVESAVNALKKHIKHFIPPEKPKWSSKIWRIISDELGNQWNENAVRTNVNENRRNILSIALKECGYFTNETDIKSNVYDDEVGNENVDSSSSDGDDEDNDPDYCDQAAYFIDVDEIEEFDVEISRNLWNSVIESSGNKTRLSKGVWTNVVAYAFWEQYRLKCCFIFDKGSVNVNGNYYLAIKAHCKSKVCGNRLFGFIEDVPYDEDPVFIKIKCRDTRHIEKHEDFQRPLRGEIRKSLSRKVKDLGVHGYTRQAAATLLRPGDTGCPFLYKSNVLHQAKKQFLDNERGIKPIDRKDIFTAISRLNENPLYRNSIILIGKPFFVIYATQSQMHCYKEYRRLHRKLSSICIDASGGVVRKICIDGRKSSYIFLYQIVVNFNKTSQCVYQMLSEMQDAHTITLWLNKWVSAVKLRPHEAVSDGSRAQLNAMSRAFNDMSLKQYIKVCFENLQNTQRTTDIMTFIRLDVAHFVHTITGWKCFKSVLHPSVKKFYIYCICLLIDSKDFVKFERILMLILIVSNIAHEDSIVCINGEKFTSVIAKTELENLISGRNVKQFFVNVSEQVEKLEIDPQKNNFKDIDLENSEKDSISISSWIKNLLKICKNVIYQGEKLQGFFLPTLEGPLVEAVVEFPLWTNICIPHSDLRATSSYVEEDFKDLKMALRHQVSLPTDIYTFLKLHLDYLIGGVNLLRMKITKFIDENLNNTEKSHTDLFDCSVSQINEENTDSSKHSVKKGKIPNDSDESTYTINSNVSQFNANEDFGLKNTENRKKGKKLPNDSDESTYTNSNVSQFNANVNFGLENPENSAFDQEVEVTSDIYVSQSDVNVKFDFSNPESSVNSPEINIDNNLLHSLDMAEEKNNTSSELNQVVSVTSNIDKSEFNINNSTDESVNINYNLSDILKEKNRNDPFENWRGKAENNKLNRFDWMASTDTSDDDETKPDIKTNSIQIDNVNNNSEINNINSEIKLANRYNDSSSMIEISLKDHDYELKTSTPLGVPKQKRTLSIAIDQVARKKINSGKYFNDCPEIKLQNKLVKCEKKSGTSEKKSKKKITYLLHNGNYCKAVSYKGCDWLVHNTCPFDTIIHILFEGALQDLNFSEFCKNSKNDTFQFLMNFKKQGPTDNIYENRLEILHPIYKNTERKQQKIVKKNHVAIPISRTIFCEDNVSVLWTRLFANEPSIFEKTTCPTPNCKGNNIKNIANFPVNYIPIIKRGFGFLQKALEFDSIIYNMTCKYCHGNKITRRQNPNFYIYVELDVKTPQETLGRKCKLRELPAYLTLPVADENDIVNHFHYRLSGVAGYSDFHYIAYCRRLSGAWISYDDQTKKPNSESDNLKVLPHGVLYVRSIK